MLEKIKKFLTPNYETLIGVLFTMMLAVVIVALMIGTDKIQKTELNAKELKLWNKRVKVTARQDSIITSEIRRLRENETIIISASENEDIIILRIPIDSLQYYADSLYNRL